MNCEQLKKRLDDLEQRLRLQEQCGMTAAAGRTRHLIREVLRLIEALC